MTDYENYILEEDEHEETEKDNAGFEIVSDLQAEWAIKKIKKATEEHERLVNLATEEINEITARTLELDRKFESDTAFLKSKLYEYFQKVEHKETKTQETYKLLAGSLVFKKPSQKMNPVKDKLLDYVKANNMPEFVKVKEEVDWAKYKKECEIANGKVINIQNGDFLPEDIITVEDTPGEFNIKF